MAHVFRLFLVLLLTFCNNTYAESIGSDGKNIRIESAPDLYVEMMSIIFPKHSEVAMGWVSQGVTSNLMRLNSSDIFSISPPESVYKDQSNHFFSKTGIQNKDTASPAGRVFEYVLKNTMMICGFLVILLASINFFTHLFKYIRLGSDSESDPDEISGLKKDGGMAAFTIAIALIFFVPYGDNGTVLILNLVLFVSFIGAFSISIISAIFFVSNFEFAELSDEAINNEWAIDYSKSIIETVPDIAFARIVFDAVLEKKLNDGIVNDVIGGITNQRLVGLGEAQIEINNHLPPAIRTAINPECYLNRDWVENSNNDGCQWVMGDANGIDAQRLMINVFATPKSEWDGKDVPAAEVVANTIKPQYEQAVNEYDDWLRSTICKEYFFSGNNGVDISRLRTSLVCAKRAANGSLIDGEYHGFSRSGGGVYIPVSSGINEVMGVPELPSLKKLKEDFEHLVVAEKRKYAIKYIVDGNNSERVVYIRGLLDQPWKLMAFLSGVSDIKLDSFKAAQKELDSEFMPVANRELSASFSKFSGLIRNIDESKEIEFLDKHYPILSLVWGKDLKASYVESKPSFHSKKQINKNPIYSINETQSATSVVYVASLVSHGLAKFFADKAGNDAVKATGLLLKVSFFAMVFFKFIVMLMVGFLFYCTVSHIFRVIVQVLAMPLQVCKMLVDVFMGESRSDDDWFAVQKIKTIILNTVLLQFVMVVCFLVGMVMSYVIMILGQIFIDVMVGSLKPEGESLLMSLGRDVLYIIMKVFLVGLSLYFGVVKLPYNLYKKMETLLGDDASIKLEENESMSQVIVALDPFKK